MLPSKLKALNASSSDESSNDEEAPVKITKEALETKAQLQYSQALQYLATERLDDAEVELYKLLESEIISCLNTTLNQKDSSKSVLAHLKYCCLTNLGNIMSKKSKFQIALTHYQEALKMDSTDLNLWYRIGLAHSKLYHTDQAISAFLEGLKCNPNHWPTLDKLITLLFASSEFVCCLYYISISLCKDPGYLKGHFIKELIYKKFPSLISYFKSYCPNGGLDVECTDEIDENIQQRVLGEITDIKTNDPSLKVEKHSYNNTINPILCAKTLNFANLLNFGKWLLNIYDNIFEHHNHSLLYEPIKLYDESSDQMDFTKCLKVDNVLNEKDFKKTSFKHHVVSSKRRKSSPSLDQLKLSRRSARNKANTKANESSLAKAIWNIMPSRLIFNKDGSDKININSIKWSDDSMDTMDLYRLYEFSDALSDGQTENLLKSNLSDEERLKQIKSEGFFGTEFETKEIKTFLTVNENKSISEFLQNYLIVITSKWNYAWPLELINIYIDIFKRVWIHTGKQNITNINKTELHLLDDLKQTEIKNDVLSVLTYGELLCDQYFQLRLDRKPLEGSIFGGDFCSLWIGDIDDILNVLDIKGDNDYLTNRFLWLRALFYLQDKETELTCDVLDMLVNNFDNHEDFEIVLPNLEYFYKINKKIVEKLITTLKRNNLLSTVKDLYEIQEYQTIINVLQETLKSQSRSTIEIPNYKSMTRLNQYIYLLKSLLEQKNYHELFKWCESCLYEAILHHRKSLIEECDSTQKNCQAEFINNIFYAMLESIRTVGLCVFDELTQGYKSRLLQSVINLLSYLIETVEGNPSIEVIPPWLLVYHLLKCEESNTEDPICLPISGIPHSLSLLILGHEYLGKRSWCCFEDGGLLYLTLNEIQPYIHSDIYNEVLCQHVEQIFYCLYTHTINKRNNKPRGNLVDHSSMGLALTWPRARQLVQFHRPIELPSYDDKAKSFPVNNSEAILKQVINLIPNEINPERLKDNLTKFIRGVSDKLPVNDNLLPNDVKDIFYLIADYNFKNKNLKEAIQYYLLDLCNNIDRFDSWAAMALARGSLIETLLNSCNSIKSEGKIIREAHMAGRCFKQSLKLSPENTKILIEYGTFTYSIQSYCSRLLKQETSNMSLQMFGELEKEKEKMIIVAQKCFESANNVWEYTECDDVDERWIHHYILGKIAEKNEDNPTLFMDHYLKAIAYLDSYGAKYPELIQFNTPQYYSMELLEIYYRIHAAALKLLEKYDNNSISKELLVKIENFFVKLSNSSPISNKDTTTNSETVNCKESENVRVALGCDLNDVVESKRSAQTNKKIVLDDLQIPLKKIKLDNSSNDQDLSQLYWKLVQWCLAALENCMKRFPQHYKSYYRLAHFYFRSPTHKDFTKCRELLLGKNGLFANQTNRNFFQGIWRIPVGEIDRPGSFAYHMSRSIHLLLDFLKETGDYKALFELALQLKNKPDPTKKYLRDDEREGISKEALNLSIQILRKLKSENAKTNSRTKNEQLLVEVYRIYKQVIKHWSQKDNTLSKLLLNVYQHIFGIKDEVPIDVIIKYSLKLEKQKETGKTVTNNENIIPSTSTVQQKYAYKFDYPPITSTPLPAKTQKRQLYSDLPSVTTSNLPNQLNSLISTYKDHIQYPTSNYLENYNNPLQHKLQESKPKIKRISKKKTLDVTDRTPMNLSLEHSDISQFLQNKSKVNSKSINDEMKCLQKSKSIEVEMNYQQQLSTKSKYNLFGKSSELIKPIHHYKSTPEVEINRIINPKPNKKLNEQSLEKIKSNKLNIEKCRLLEFNQTSGMVVSKVKEPPSTSKRNAVYINLDSAAEQARLKSTVFHNTIPKMKKPATAVPMNPAMLLSSCPGLSITPISNKNENKVRKDSKNIIPLARNLSKTSEQFNFQQAIQQLGKDLTITKTEKSSNK